MCVRRASFVVVKAFEEVVAAGPNPHADLALLRAFPTIAHHAVFISECHLSGSQRQA